MVTKRAETSPSQRASLDELIREHEAMMLEYRKTHVDPARELDQFLRDQFLPEVLLSIVDSRDEENLDDLELNGW